MRKHLIGFIAIAFVLISCRTAGPTVTIRDSSNVTITVSSHTDAAQGKTVPVDIARNAKIPTLPIP